MGTGVMPGKAADDMATAVVRLARASERGERPPVWLIFECLARVRELDVSASGGDALLWMVTPVLRAALQRLEHEDGSRRALEAEVAALRAQSEGLAMDVEDKAEAFRRMQARARERLWRREEETQELIQTCSSLRHEVASMEAERSALAALVERGHHKERLAWEREESELQAEIASLDEQEANLLLQLDLREPTAAAKEQVNEVNQIMQTLHLNLMRYAQLRKRLRYREMQILELKQALQELEEKREAELERRRQRQERKAKKLQNRLRRSSPRSGVRSPPLPSVHQNGTFDSAIANSAAAGNSGTCSSANPADTTTPAIQTTSEPANAGGEST